MVPKSLAMRMMGHVVVQRGLRPRSALVKTIVTCRLRTRRLGPPPSFLIIGTQRGGTTNLYSLLLGHPLIYPSLVKEVHYFDQHFHRGAAWYRAHFAAGCALDPIEGGRPITGEATPCYLFHPLAADRTAELNPEAKLIVLLRNPVDRAYSHYSLTRAWGWEPLSFEEALDREEERMAADEYRMRQDELYCGRNWSRYSYVRRGIYADQLPAWLERFGPDQLLILQSEAFFADPLAALERITEFLGLPSWRPNLDQGYPKIAQAPMESATRARLTDFYQPHNERLFALLGRSFDWEGVCAARHVMQS